MLQNRKHAAVLLHGHATAGQWAHTHCAQPAATVTKVLDCCCGSPLQMDDITVVVSFISEAAGDSLNSSENGSASSSADSDGQLPELKPPPSKL